MIKTNFAKFLECIRFWSNRIRNRFRKGFARRFHRLKWWTFHSSLTPISRDQGDRLVEQRIYLFGICVSVRRSRREKYRVGLLVDEFFGGWDTAIGGYGALARKYICRYVPDDEIQIDLLMDHYGGLATQEKLVDETMVYRLPASAIDRQNWLDQQGYDLFLSIEMTEPSFKILGEYVSNTPLLYWIQDPRDLTMYQSRLQTVKRIKDFDWAYIKEVSVWMQELIRLKRVSFISQGESLSAIARDMYQIPGNVPIQDLPNPVEMDSDYKLECPPKGNKIIFLGRLEAQKRVWMVCEIAIAMPDHEFYILGATGKGRDEAANAKTLESYRNPDGTSKIKNLHFTGHVDGPEKCRHIKEAKLLLNTSIWEGIPVSWLEALSYGTLVVSAFERDNIVGRFGTFVGEVMGDGTTAADLQRFTKAIEYWMTHDLERKATAQQAIEFVRARHSIPNFINNMRSAIHREIR